MSEHEIGTGVLSWHRGERVSDRYGSVGLIPKHRHSLKGTSDFPYASAWLPLTRFEGRGRLIADVLETRDSTHIGDFFRGVGPTRPEVGERIVLGEGTLFYEDDFVGLRPDDGREHDWLDIKALYRAHEQTVRLVFDAE